MCFNSSSSSSKATEVRDERVGADNGATAFRAEGTNSITVGSDDTAQLAIESTTNALTTTTDLIGSAFSNFLNLTDKRLERADLNIASQNETTARLLENEQQTSDDRLIKVIQFAGLAAVGVVFIQSGALKDITGAFK